MLVDGVRSSEKYQLERENLHIYHVRRALFLIILEVHLMLLHYCIVLNEDLTKENTLRVK